MDPLVVQHCFGAPHTGGPAAALSRLQAMRTHPYPEIWQREAAGGFSLQLIRRFKDELRRLRPQLLHVRGLGNEGFHAALAGRLAGVPHILVSVHGTQRDLVGSGGLRRATVVNLLEPATLRMADAIVTMCHSAAQRSFLDPVRHKMLVPVPNGVALPGPEEMAKGTAIRERLGIAADRIVAVIVSRLTEQKGYADLAQALRHIEAADGPDIDLIVVGGGDEDGRIARLFDGLVRCRVHFTGQQSEVGPYLAAADLFVFPSWHENLSNALIEAMAYRLPVVATAVGGNVEVLNHGGGVLVPARNAGALAGAMLRLVKDAAQREAMGHAALGTIVEHYSLDRMARSWEAHYRAVAAT
ncbi:glycosyltransferase [Sphingobium wenxiniae]|uniref:Glycosyltransferase involved in cell wall biosynthesis n=1 Tax=Sphingobium wenxiniae (strain DSM 21828 / CGMCC 1.7748 / JZ-1) TaxID=595605 RepID=A0A562K509_SPHWJ|nr:glycosyltransferase [Sphingobium wenxiniae]TWH90531.1 glycosyltransferase involved in cell wall biosynthesis [Sphingobium wenxiniae]